VRFHFSVGVDGEHVFVMHPRVLHPHVTALVRAGLSDYEIARRTGVSRSTVQRWRLKGLPTRCPSAPPDPSWRPPEGAPYAYLLGIYLGDGCLSTGWGQPELYICLDGLYPGILDEAESAIKRVVPGLHVSRYARPGSRAIVLNAWSSKWLVAFPQHGPGRKHKRRIELVDWQRSTSASMA